MVQNTASQTNPWWVLIALSILIFIVNVDYTAVNLALVSISHELHTNLATLQWLLSSYLLAWAASIVPAGRFADIYGKRRILLYGVGVFIVSSLLIGSSKNLEMLIFGRALQGIGGALFVPCLYALVFSVFPSNKQGLAIGYLGAAAGIGLAVGPTLSGFILAYMNWRWLFWINVPLCFLTAAIIVLNIPKEPRRILDESIDLIGALLFAIILSSCIYVLNDIPMVGLTKVNCGLFALTVISAIAFIWKQLYSSSPFIPAHLLRNRIFSFGATLPFMTHQFSFTIIIVMMSFYLQNICKYSPYETGLIFLALTGSFGILSIFGGQLVEKIGLRIPCLVGLALVAAGELCAAFLGLSFSLSNILFVLIVCGIGLGFCFSSFNTAMMKAVPPETVTSASSLFAMGCLLAHVFAVILISTTISQGGLFFLNGFLESYQLNLNASEIQQVVKILSSAHRDPTMFEGFLASQIQSVKQVIDVTFVVLQSYLFLFTALLVSLGCLLTYRFLWLDKSATTHASISVNVI